MVKDHKLAGRDKLGNGKRGKTGKRDVSEQVEIGCKNQGDDEKSREQEEVRDEDSEWQGDLERLLEVGRTLDRPSRDPYFWRQVLVEQFSVPSSQFAVTEDSVGHGAQNSASKDDRAIGTSDDRVIGGYRAPTGAGTGQGARPHIGGVGCTYVGEVPCPYIGACPYVEGEGCPCRKLWKMPDGDAWIERNLKIRTKLGEVRYMKLNAAQLRYSYDCAEKKAKRNIVLKARQMGITSYVAARFFVQTVTRPGTLTMLVAHDRESAEEIVRIVHRFWDNLKEKLQKGLLKTSHKSGRELVFPRLDSEFTVSSADENAGRGRTIQNLHCTEVSRWGRNAAEALASLRAAVVPGGEIVLESTANGAWGTFYDEWQKAEETGYTRHFFPWWYEESYRTAPGIEFEMTEEEAEIAAAHGLTTAQIAWRRQQWAVMRGLSAQEFAEDAVSCFRASGECVFEMNVIDRALASADEPVETKDNARLSIWLPPQKGKEYVIGVDPAGGGTRGDYSCAEVIDRKTGAQCAELHGHWSLPELARQLIKLGKQYNLALLAVERNNHGHAVLVQLRHKNYPNVYEQKGKDGWNTTAASRPEMIERMAAVVAENPELLRSARLWNECRTFVRNADGASGAAPGAHDDCVIAMAIAMAVREEEAGRNWARRSVGTAAGN